MPTYTIINITIRIRIIIIITLILLALTSALPLVAVAGGLPALLIHLLPTASSSILLPSSRSSSSAPTMWRCHISNLHGNYSVVLHKWRWILIIPISRIHLHKVSGVYLCIGHSVLAGLCQLHRLVQRCRVLYKNILPDLWTKTKDKFVEKLFAACSIDVCSDTFK